MNPAFDYHKEPFETIEVTETFSCNTIQRLDLESSNLCTEVKPPTAQESLPGNTYARTEFSICFFFETCAVSPPLHPNVYFLHQVDKGYWFWSWESSLWRGQRGLYFFSSSSWYFCFKMSFKLLAFLDNKWKDYS